MSGCPMEALEDWVFEHWDVVSLCASHACEECVLVEPWQPEPEPGRRAPDPPDGGEIPF